MEFRRVASGYDFLEGPRPDGFGGLYFTSNTGCHHLSPEGVVTDLAGTRGCGGIVLHSGGGIVISGPNLARWHDGVLTTLHEFDDVLTVNDIFTTPQGHVLAGTARGNWTGDQTGTDRPGELWEVTAPGQAHQLYDGVTFTNGIALSPDGATIYHADSFGHRILAHHRDGSPLAPIPIDGPGIPDGLVVDETGALWMAFYGGGRIERRAPSGEVLETHAVAAHNVTSLVIDESRLYVVTCDSTDDASLKGSIWAADAAVKGLAAAPATI